MNHKLILKAVFLTLFLVVAVLLTIWAFPKVMELKDPAVREMYKNEVENMGISGWFIMLGIQAAQVVFAIIPREPVEVLSGLLFGAIPGLILCLLGIFIGTVIIYYVVKLLGRPFVEFFISQEKLDKLSFLHDTKKLGPLVFLLFFIPGTPKDLLTYIVPLTNLKPLHFFLISTFARIPSIITSTYAGAAIYQENLWGSIIMFAVAGGLAIVGILINKKLMAYLEKRRKKHPHKTKVSK